MAFLPWNHIPDRCLHGTDPDGPVYRGRFAGIIPIYIGRLDIEAPIVSTANWVPDWVLDLAEYICYGVDALTELFGGEPSEAFPLQVRSRFDGLPLKEDPVLQAFCDDE